MAQKLISARSGVLTSTPARLVAGFLVLFLLTGCSESNRCRGSSVPQFDTDVLSTPILNQVYSQVIRASVKNSIQDDLYGYTFSLHGELPAGMSSRQDDRRFIFEGTPTELGEFPLELTVRLSSGINILDIADADADDLCRSSETVAYNLNVTL